jgi:mono/diheme cytochrome c family protein
MPPFKTLNHDEVDALVDYLDALARIPEAPARQPAITESELHVGEELVSGTCQICHDASGPDPGRMGLMMSGRIPPLSSLTQDYSVDEVVAKVREGRSAGGGMMGMMASQPKMPRLPYLTSEEVTAAFRYLQAFPPRS